MKCCAKEQGESGAGSGGVGFKVVYNRMWCPGVCLESVISISGNSEMKKKFFLASTLYIFGHMDTLFSLCFIKTHMRCCYLFSTTGILTKELLEITIFILTANFLWVTSWTWVTSCWLEYDTQYSPAANWDFGNVRSRQRYSFMWQGVFLVKHP